MGVRHAVVSSHGCYVLCYQRDPFFPGGCNRHGPKHHHICHTVTATTVATVATVATVNTATKTKRAAPFYPAKATTAATYFAYAFQSTDILRTSAAKSSRLDTPASTAGGIAVIAACAHVCGRKHRYYGDGGGRKGGEGRGQSGYPGSDSPSRGPLPILLLLLLPFARRGN